MADEVEAVEVEEAPEPEPEVVVPVRRSLADLIRDADPSWQEGESTSHLQAITGRDGSIAYFVKGEEAPGVSGPLD